MKFSLVKLEQLSGRESSIYSVIVGDDEKTLLDTFYDENIALHQEETNWLLKRLKTIGTMTGAREGYFKHNEGNPGDQVCVIRDNPNKKLRLYCIRIGMDLVIVGGGGPKKTKTLQDDPKLKKENYLLREVSKRYLDRILTKDIYYNGKDIQGDLFFDDDQ